MKNFLIESALLTHGLVSLKDEFMEQFWPKDLDNIAWVDRGQIRTGSIANYLSFRRSHEKLLRIDSASLSSALSEGCSGGLTASGTMAACLLQGLSLAVTCGMGGIGNIRGAEFSADLTALSRLPVALIATSPKDMLDIPATINWLAEHGVKVLGYGSSFCDGFIFPGAKTELAGCMERGAERPLLPGELLLNAISKECRLQDTDFLRQGIEAGKAAVKKGEYFHPAVNGAIDSLSKGQSAMIQLRSLIDNALLAERCC